jgi:exodeoxyribonuclease VII small subunit
MKKQHYESALEELQQIIQDLQEGNTSMDELADKSKRAKELIRFCKEKLRNTEEVVKTLFEE